MNFICLTLGNGQSIMVNMDHVIWVQDLGDFRRIETRGPGSGSDVLETLEEIAGFITVLKEGTDGG